VKLYKIFFLITASLIPSCDEASNTISNVPKDINEIYEFNLAFTEDTDNSDSITLLWTKNSEIITFNIEIDGETNTALEEGQYTFPLSPGSFKDVIITADDIHSETIKIFSSPMAPSTWEPDFVGDIKVSNSETENGFKNQFGWNASLETDIIKFELYKSPQSQTDIITYNEDINLSIWSKIPSFNINSVSPFSENELSQGEYYCYITKSIDIKENSRFSQIICNDLTANTMESVNLSSISTNLENKIRIEWVKYNGSDFYQYILYRNNNEGVENDSLIILAKIIDASQTVFEDRNNIGKGITWYYQIEVHNQYGRTKKSNLELGKSKP